MNKLSRTLTPLLMAGSKLPCLPPPACRLLLPSITDTSLITLEEIKRLTVEMNKTEKELKEILKKINTDLTQIEKDINTLNQDIINIGRPTPPNPWDDVTPIGSEMNFTPPPISLKMLGVTAAVVAAVGSFFI